MSKSGALGLCSKSRIGNDSNSNMSRRAARIGLVGDAGVGKTSICLRISGNTFDESVGHTIQANFEQLEWDKCDEPVFMSIWDTAGQEQYKSLTRQYLRNVDFAILTYDITSKATFDNLQSWISFVLDVAPHCRIVVVGNKADLENRRVVQIPDAMAMAQTHDTPYIEVSAKTGVGIENLLNYIGNEFIRMLATGNIHNSESVMINERRRRCRC